MASVEGLDEHTKKKVDFFTRQYIDALAPSNFALTNPEVFRETVATGGQNLVKGLHNLLDDIERGGGQLRISMTDAKAFELGVNIATTPGKVVFQNELMQLIQYEPSTKKQWKRPLLIIPPWINKYYILDLREKNSFMRWAVGRGHDGLRDLVGQSRREARAQELRGLPDRGHARGAVRHREGDRASRTPTSSATASAARSWRRRWAISPRRRTSGSRARPT